MKRGRWVEGQRLCHVMLATNFEFEAGRSENMLSMMFSEYKSSEGLQNLLNEIGMAIVK